MEVLTGELYQMYKEDFNIQTFQTIPKIEEKRTLPNSFYKDTIALIPKPKILQKKEKNQRPISLMNIGVKTLKKLAN